MRVVIILLTVFLGLLAQGAAQPARIEGRVVNARTGEPLPGAHLRLSVPGDESRTRTALTGDAGEFALTGVAYRSYQLEATFVGFTPLVRTLTVASPVVNLHDLALEPSIIELGEVTVNGTPPPAVQKADTTEFFAGAFKTNPDATAEDLVSKLPGITVENGSVKAEGEDIQKVLVDGKEFFGTDPTLALRNLPADAIEKIQVFDKMSDQAEFTGFDDGQSMKTLNIITRPERRNGQFGRIYGGYGEDKHYAGGGAMNSFANDQRISVVGIANNVNQQNFSAQDILGVLSSNGGPRGGGGGFGGGFGGGGGIRNRGSSPGGGSGRILGAARPGGTGLDPGTFLVGQQSGINTARSVGLNYQDAWSGQLQVSGSYFYNVTGNTNAQTLTREFFAPGSAGQTYHEVNSSNGTNTNNRASVRMEYRADSMNSVLFTPQFSTQTNRATSSLSGVNTVPGVSALSQSTSGTTSSGVNFNGHLLYRHKFDLPGRTVSFDVGVTESPKKKTSDLSSLVQSTAEAPLPAQALDQQGGNTVRGSTLSARAVYTEPLSVNSLVQVNYAPSVTRSSSEARTFDLNRAAGTYSLLDSTLSNSYDNTYVAQTAGIGYLYRAPGLTWMAGLSYQAASLDGSTLFPAGAETRRTFGSLLPTANINFTPGTGTNLRVFYRTSTQAPAIMQLQGVIDNTNPLYLSGGNPGLRQSYSHTLVSRYSVTSAERGRSRFLLFALTYTKDYIANAVTTFSRDTVLTGGAIGARGTQLTMPVNLSGYWNARGFYTMGIPAGFISSNVSLNSGLTYTRTPGLIDGVRNNANQYILSQGVVVASNVSQEIDFQLSYNGSYTWARNSLQSGLNSNYYTHTIGVMFNWIFWGGWVLRNELSNIATAGQAQGYGQHSVLWTAAFSRKFLAEQRGELKLSVVDILKQNQSTNRTITDTYVEDTINTALPRYALLTFTYTVR